VRQPYFCVGGFIMAPRILLCGDVLGRLSQLFKRVSSVSLTVSFVASNLGFVSIVTHSEHCFHVIAAGEQICRSIRRAFVRRPVFPGLTGATGRIHGLH